jgi:hypothetical protein
MSIYTRLKRFYKKELKTFMDKGIGEPVGYQRAYFQGIEHILDEFKGFDGNGDGWITIEYLRGLEAAMAVALKGYNKLAEEGDKHD